MAETNPITLPVAGPTGNARRAERIDIEAANRRDHLAHQLYSLTAILYGEGGESFRNYSHDIQDGVLWLVHDLAEQVMKLSFGKEGP